MPCRHGGGQGHVGSGPQQKDSTMENKPRVLIRTAAHVPKGTWDRGGPAERAIQSALRADLDRPFLLGSSSFNLSRPRGDPSVLVILYKTLGSHVGVHYLVYPIYPIQARLFESPDATVVPHCYSHHAQTSFFVLPKREEHLPHLS